MKNNRNVFILVIVLGLICLWLILTKTNSTLTQGPRNFALSDTSIVTKIILADINQHQITLEKVEHGQWKLNEQFMARTDAVKLLLQTMKQLDIKSPVGKSARATVLKSIASKGVKVEVYAGNKRIKLYYVGAPTADLLGTYMLLANPTTGENADSPFITWIPGFDGFLTPRYFTTLADWKSRTIFTYIPPEIQSITMDYPSKPGNGFELKVHGNLNFELIDSKTQRALTVIDTAAVKQYLGYFQDVQFEMIETLTPSLLDSIKSSTPIAILTLKEKKGNIKTLKIFHKEPSASSFTAEGKPAQYDVDRIYGDINNTDFVTMQYFVIGKLMQPLGYFMPKSIVKK